MFIPQYKPDHKFSYWEILNKFPEYAEMIQQQNTWAQYEQKPNLAGLPPEVVKMIPQAARDGKEDTRIDAWIL